MWLRAIPLRFRLVRPRRHRLLRLLLRSGRRLPHRRRSARRPQPRLRPPQRSAKPRPRRLLRSRRLQLRPLFRNVRWPPHRLPRRRRPPTLLPGIPSRPMTTWFPTTTSTPPPTRKTSITVATLGASRQVRRAGMLRRRHRHMLLRPRVRTSLHDRRRSQRLRHNPVRHRHPCRPHRSPTKLPLGSLKQWQRRNPHLLRRRPQCLRCSPRRNRR